MGQTDTQISVSELIRDVESQWPEFPSLQEGTVEKTQGEHKTLEVMGLEKQTIENEGNTVVQIDLLKEKMVSCSKKQVARVFKRNYFLK